MRRTIPIVLAAVLFWSCSMPATKIYTLYFPDNAVVTDKANGNSLALIVHAPKYLSQPYIAYRNSPYELRIARYSKWESPPDKMIGEMFRECLLSSGIFHEVRILRSARPGVYRLDLDIRNFERTDERNKSYGLFVMHANLADAKGNSLFRENISKKQELTDSEFETLAKGMSILVSQACEELRTEILRHSAQ